MSWDLRECMALAIFSGVMVWWVTAEMWATLGAIVCFWQR